MEIIQEYNLKITERQSRLIITSLDLYTRLSVGQFHNLKDISFEKDKDGINRQPSDETLKKLQSEMFPKLQNINASYGIHSKELPDEIREAYDIFKVMMYEFNKDKGAINVYADKVRQASKQPLPLFDKDTEVVKDEPLERDKNEESISLERDRYGKLLTEKEKQIKKEIDKK